MSQPIPPPPPSGPPDSNSDRISEQNSGSATKPGLSTKSLVLSVIGIIWGGLILAKAVNDGDLFVVPTSPYLVGKTAAHLIGLAMLIAGLVTLLKKRAA